MIYLEKWLDGPLKIALSYLFIPFPSVTFIPFSYLFIPFHTFSIPSKTNPIPRHIKELPHRWAPKQTDARLNRCFLCKGIFEFIWKSAAPNFDKLKIIRLIILFWLKWPFGWDKNPFSDTPIWPIAGRAKSRLPEVTMEHHLPASCCAGDGWTSNLTLG